MIKHAGLIALWTTAGWRGALISGPSGVGKSDLILRCLGEGFRLVADDRCRLIRVGDHLFGAPPAPLAGLLEVRGLGVVTKPHRLLAPVDLLVVCLREPERPERIPEVQLEVLLGVPTPRLSLNPLEASAPSKLKFALDAPRPRNNSSPPLDATTG